MRFGRLTVIRLYRRTAKYRLFVCQCKCGTRKAFRFSNLRSGSTKSCGCYNRETLSARAKTHGRSGKDRTYQSWNAMRDRCNYPKNKDFKNYGGRGLTVCKRWNSFEVFVKDMGNRPIGKTLDRIKNGKGYSPSNCRWATPKQQAANRRQK